MRIMVLTFILAQASCKKFVDAEVPPTSSDASIVFGRDANAIAVLNGIYSSISGTEWFSSGGLTSLSLFASLCADELENLSFNSDFQAFYLNALTKSNGGGNYWRSTYPIIFTINSAIEGLNTSTSLTPSVKQQLLGESKFLRAFCYFYLVNLYGDVPLAVSSDYTVNRLLPRSSKQVVYQQIINDLKDAQKLLSDKFLRGDLKATSNERISPTKWAATALLSRVYLYTGDNENAELESSAVINHTALFELSTVLSQVFQKNSREAIWQLQPVLSSPSNTQEGSLFILPSTGPDPDFYPVFLSASLLNTFESGDKRRFTRSWIDSVSAGGTNYFYANKYKDQGLTTTVTEYTMVLRLAEQYLIRAEARARRNNLSGAQADLNSVRLRAGLSPTTANSQNALIDAVLHERRVELFTEWGHRWLDLKRTNTIDAVMGAPGNATALKGGVWNSNWALFPIPQREIDLNPSMTGAQNPGYN